MTASLSIRDDLAPFLSNAPKMVAVLFAYLDESGLNETARATVVGGLMGPVTSWVPFEGRWRTRLAVAGLPHFHAQRCQRGTKEYKHISEQNRMRLYDDLAEIAADYGFEPISGAVLQPDWSLARKDDAFRERYPTAYSFAFELCMMRIQDIAKRSGMRAQIFYGFSSAYAKRAELIAQAYTASQRYAQWIAACDVKKPEDVTPLQAADMLCYEVYHQYQSSGVRVSPVQRLIGRLPFGALGYYYNQSAIETVVDNGPLGSRLNQIQ